MRIELKPINVATKEYTWKEVCVTPGVFVNVNDHRHDTYRIMVAVVNSPIYVDTTGIVVPVDATSMRKDLNLQRSLFVRVDEEISFKDGKIAFIPFVKKAEKSYSWREIQTRDGLYSCIEANPKTRFLVAKGSVTYIGTKFRTDLGCIKAKTTARGISWSPAPPSSI